MTKVFAEITGETAKNPKVSKIGSVVEILRPAPNRKFWIRTKAGEELVWHLAHLKLITKGETNEKTITNFSNACVV